MASGPSISSETASAQQQLMRVGDVDALFRKQSVNDIRRLQTELARDVQQRKQGLRLMVGESYRDIIAASESISEMKTLAAEVSGTLSSVRDNCDSEFLQRRTNQARNEGKDVVQEERKRLFYPIAAQIKLLVDTPEQASHAFLLAKLVYRNLQTSAESAVLNLQATFPLITRQNSSINPFRSQILSRAAHHLRSPIPTSSTSLALISPTALHTARTLLACALLDQSRLVDLLKMFLDARLVGLRDTLGGAGSFSPTLTRSAQSAHVLRASARHLAATLRLVCTVFAPDAGGRCLVYNTYVADVDTRQHHLHHQSAAIITTSASMAIDAKVALSQPVFATVPARAPHAVSRHLPAAVQSYRPVLDSRDTLSLEALRSAVTAWLDHAVVQAKNDLERVLESVRSVKEWQEARKGAMEEVEVIETRAEEEGGSWGEVCQTTLSRSFHLWHDLLRSIFRVRAEGIVKELCGQVGEMPQAIVKTQLERLAESGEDSNLSLFVWSLPLVNDSPSDLLTSTSNTATSRIRSVADRAMGLTKLLEGAVEEFEEVLSGVKLGVKEIVGEDGGEKLAGKDTWGTKEDAASLVAASESILADAVARYRNGLVVLIEAESQRVREASSEENKRVAIDRALFVGRLARAIVSKNASALSSAGRTQSSRATITKMSLDQRIEAADHPVVIQGETDSGKTEEAKLMLPSLSSRFIVEALFAVCVEIDRVGGYLIEPVVIHRALVLLANSAFSFLREELKSNRPRFTDQLYLQLFFDARYLVKVFQGCWLRSERSDSALPGEEPLPVKEVEAMADEVLAEIRKEIDPIELTVAEPHLSANIDRCYVRSSSLFGSLLLFNPKTIEPKRPTSFTENYNALSVAAQAPRFVLLPSILSAASTLPGECIRRTGGVPRFVLLQM
ncbi:Golgi transport complex subunit 1 [Gonapodya sp. JEL0774]|nr:Golgi transport complex subunit 1 [Gonapodya sp. JEL0774]